MKFEEVDVLRDPDGVSVVITKRIDGPHLSFAIVKEFERDGQVFRTGFLSRRHIVAVRRLLERVEERLDQEIDRSKAASVAAR